jgi:protein-S-isoprenylcysteine O-methyltransferase Ste14
MDIVMNKLETRIPPPLIAIVIGLVMWQLIPAAMSVEEGALIRQSIAAIVAFIGLACDFLGAVSFRKAKTTVNPMSPEKSSALVCTGIYKYSRNPMYLGMALLLLAWAIYLASAWALLGVLAYVLYITRFQIIPEERVMEKLFGQEYLAYKAKVRRWL